MRLAEMGEIMDKIWNKLKWFGAMAVSAALMPLQHTVVSADMIDRGEVQYSNVPGAPWMELAVIIIVGLMVIFAIAAIVFMYHQKKTEEEARKQREEAEREEQ